MAFYQTGGNNFQSLSPPEQARYRYLVAWWLTFYENLHYQHEAGLLDDGIYRAWMKDMEGFVRRRRVDNVWESLKPNYNESFVKVFEPLIEDIRKRD